MKAFVEYFIPEDGGTENQTNLFAVKKSYDQVMLSDIKEAFPVKGEFHFRFKFSMKNKNYWIDFNNPSKAVPQYEKDKIIVKASRLDEIEEESNLY